ncbi:hypothetical protein [Streptomyces sp. NBC_00286]|uniref:hypothetical protein n=1 Tax=Streptomyces sp. NBC_00286 TaxID=2975701 RepID=UPI002E27FD45|nr:hypothetical protein [Streptomyces sp. NBC_00286]
MIHTQPQPGDIGLTQITGHVGAMIRLGQWLNGDGFGRYQHAFLVLDDDTLLEAQPGGARITQVSAYDDRNTLYVYPGGLTDAQRQAICDAGRRYVGTPYSFLDYFALATRRMRIPAPGLRAYIASTRHMICSQLVDQAYLDAGVHLFADGRWPGYVTPMALYHLLGH